MGITSLSAQSYDGDGKTHIAICESIDATNTKLYQIEISTNKIITKDLKNDSKIKIWNRADYSGLYSYIAHEDKEPVGNLKNVDWLRLDIIIDGINLNNLKFEHLKKGKRFKMEISTGYESRELDYARELESGWFNCKKTN